MMGGLCVAIAGRSLSTLTLPSDDYVLLPIAQFPIVPSGLFYLTQIEVTPDMSIGNTVSFRCQVEQEESVVATVRNTDETNMQWEWVENGLGSDRFNSLLNNEGIDVETIIPGVAPTDIGVLRNALVISAVSSLLWYCELAQSHRHKTLYRVVGDNPNMVRTFDAEYSDISRQKVISAHRKLGEAVHLFYNPLLFSNLS